jgi:predicted house-cleaning noncanonical NTP pyrophosphatase (MazG superfamily)
VRSLAAHVHFLVRQNARHVKSGRRLQELTEAELFNHLHSEVCELFAQPADIEEMGDILCILFHLAHRQGWSLDRMEEAALCKLAARFEIPE